MLIVSHIESVYLWALCKWTMEFFHSRRLWWTSGFVVAAIWRFMVLVRSRPTAESPTQEMLRDVPFVTNLFVWGAVVVAIVYRLRPG